VANSWRSRSGAFSVERLCFPTLHLSNNKPPNGNPSVELMFQVCRAAFENASEQPSLDGVANRSRAETGWREERLITPPWSDVCGEVGVSADGQMTGIGISKCTAGLWAGSVRPSWISLATLRQNGSAPSMAALVCR
jgi:hypothetical protein